MIEPNNSSMWPLVTAQRTAGSLRFFALLGMQTVGAAIMYWNVAPLYRQAIAAPTSLQVELETSISPLLAIALIQGGYWISRRTRPPLPRFTNFLLGQFILFVARMGFVLPTSIFGLVFITQNPGYQIQRSAMASFWSVCSLCTATSKNWSVWGLSLVNVRNRTGAKRA